MRTFASWRHQASALLANGVAPAAGLFPEGTQETLFDEEQVRERPPGTQTFAVPKSFIDLAQYVAMHRAPERWDLLYRTLYRIARLGERDLLQIEVDADVRKLMLMSKALDRDIHKMHAFVRFRKVAGDFDQYIAWHRPDHHIVDYAGPWFARRLGNMRWAILTPDRSAYWDLERLRFGPGVPRSEAPGSDELEKLWRSYYRSIFNPARVNIPAMKKELPVRHWATLPEADLIPVLVNEAPQRVIEMRNAAPPTAKEFLPAKNTLPALAKAIHDCRGCELYCHATQAVFGEGPAHAKVLFVGEQPGDQEDLQGKPFVGPAGQLWNKALQAAGVNRSEVYVTNAVKHFKFEERGKRRLHKKAGGGEVAACRPWLEAEIAAIKPQVIVALGATAALSVGGREFAIQKERGRFLPLAEGRELLITVHPSFLLRVPETDREAEFARFVDDLRLVAGR